MLYIYKNALSYRASKYEERVHLQIIFRSTGP